MSPSVNAEGGFDLSVERVSGTKPLVLVRIDIDDARLTILVRGFGDVPDGITMLHQVSHLSVVVPNHGLFKNARHDMSPMRFSEEERNVLSMSHPTQQISDGLLFHFLRSCFGDLSRPQVLARLEGRALSPRHSFFSFFIRFRRSIESSNHLGLHEGS